MTLTALIEYESESDTCTYEVTALKFYSDLDDGLASGYIYSSYLDTTSDYTLENLDIVYVSFGYPRNDGSINMSRVESRLPAFVERCHNYGTYVLLSLQESKDYGDADAMTTITLDNDLLNTFTSNLVDIINTYHLDGIDMDWEHPDEGEQAQYVLLMHTLHDAIKANNKYHLLTTATSGADKYSRFDLTNSINYIDYVNIMSYDLHSSSRSQFTSGMNRGTNKHYRAIIDNTYNNYITVLHLNPAKLIIGIAFYGLIYHDTDGIYTSAPGEQTEKKAYSYIYENYISQIGINPYLTRAWDDTGMGYYIYDSENRICVTYDEAESIDVKVNYAHDWGFAGAMYWQDGQDNGDELVTALVTSINNYY